MKTLQSTKKVKINLKTYNDPNNLNFALDFFASLRLYCLHHFKMFGRQTLSCCPKNCQVIHEFFSLLSLPFKGFLSSKYFQVFTFQCFFFIVEVYCVHGTLLQFPAYVFSFCQLHLHVLSCAFLCRVLLVVVEGRSLQCHLESQLCRF